MNHYIIQNMSKYLNIQHLKKDEDGMLRYIDNKITKPTFEELYNLKYLMVIAEPGYGKTRLLKEIVLKADEQNKKAFFIDSKIIKNNIIDSIQNCQKISSDISEEDLQKESLFSNTLDSSLEENTIICLDALDEFPFDKLYDFLGKIQKFIEKYKNIQLFVSCRTHHIKKVDFNLSQLPFEYITLEAFHRNQITEYLSSKFNKTILEQIEQKSNQTELFNFLSIPRYLYYFSELIKDKGIEDMTKLTRAEMFENFIYRKLNKEKGRGVTNSQYDIIKRVLEKIAIVMKINQVSQISKDELFTIFEDIDSNFSQIVFRDDLLNILYDKSIIKDNIDSIEFENQEFLDFLAAKEICRFDKVEQVFFDVAVEPHLQEVFTSWFYVLPFLLEQRPLMIRVLLTFLNKNSDKALREKYFHALVSIETKFLDSELKSQIFTFVFDYYSQHNKWLHIDSLGNFYDKDTHYKKILDSVDESKNKNNELYVRRNNAIDIIKTLIENEKLTDEQTKYWKGIIVKWLKLDIKDNKILHRNIIDCMSVIASNDFEYLKSIDFIFENGIELQYNFARACYKIAPEDKFSIDIYFDSYVMYKKNKITTSLTMDDGIRYILKLKTLDGISYAIDKLTKDYDSDENQLHYLFENLYSNYEETLNNFVTNIKNEFSIKDIDKIKELTQILGNKRFNHSDKEKYLEKLLIKYIVEQDENYIFELLESEYEKYQKNETHFWDIEHLIEYDLISYINNKNFERIHSLLKQFERENKIIDLLMYRLYTNDVIDYEIKEKIKTIYSDYIVEVEKDILKRNAKHAKDTKNKFLGLCKQWEHKIEPEKNKYMTDLFRFFSNQKKTLVNCEKYEENRLTTIEKAKDVIRHNNPLSGKVEVKGSSTTIWGVHFFKDCIELLYNEKIELDEQNLVDNTFRYLPFNINSEYEMTLKLAYKPSKEAIQDIIDVYAGKREDDLNISQPENLIQIYKNFNLKEAEDLLLAMIFNHDIREYIREQIIDILPITILTKEKVEEYIFKYGKEDKLYEKMLSILIQIHNSKSALNKAFILIMKKARAANISDSEFSIHGTSLDFTNNKLVFSIINTDYTIARDKKLLLLSEQLEKKGKRHNARFLQDIIFEHIKYLKQKNSFEPILEIEFFLQENRDKTYLHWFEYKLVELKEIYLEELAKPASISASIKKYNELKAKDYLSINSPSHLLEIIQDTISKDLTNWIENEGAYKHIGELSKKTHNTNAEDFIQKSIISQIELSLFKKGFRSTDFRIKREEQTLDDKRIDITVSYGFIGSILIELKLAHNSEAIPTQASGINYINKLKKYIDGTNSDYGIFLIFNIKTEKEKFNKQIQKLSKLYETEKEIIVLGIDCVI